HSKRTVIIRPLLKNEKQSVSHGVLNKQDDNRFYSELLSAGLSCGAAVLSWVVVGGSSVAIPVSAGASTAITILAYGAATASSLQCANSSYRLVNETDYGDNSMNAWLDSHEWYVHTTTALDVISVLGGVSAAGATLKTVINLRKAGTPVKEALKGLSRQERKRLTEEIIRANNPGISNKILKSLVAAGKYPKRYSKLQISSSVSLQLKDAIASTMSFTGSATSGIIRNPERIKNFVVGVYNEIEVY
ncbi:MAG: hypothetical protein HKN34_08720, partial [Gammaproteobacteria bacterium]|nr:hypothetical protein [Gammaproteobacteria bacterium]